MKSLIIKLLLLLPVALGMTSPQTTQAQTYFGYQSIGVHTWYFSIAWQGKPYLGVGYNLRNTNRTFTDWQFEWRFPINEMYGLDNHEIIAGFYHPLRLKRTFAGLGVHAKIRTQTLDGRKTTAFGLNTALIPTYIYASPLPANELKGSIGLRLAYQPILLARVKEGDAAPEWVKLPGHRVELGGHLDAIMEATLGMATDGYMTRSWFFKDPAAWPAREQSWEIDGDLYVGTTYYLRRW